MDIIQIKDRIFRLLDRVGLLADRAYQSHLKAEKEAEAVGQPVAFNISKEAQDVIDSFGKKPG